MRPGRGTDWTAGPEVPLHAGRAAVTPDGEVLLLAGKNTCWLLRAKLKDLAETRD